MSNTMPEWLAAATRKAPGSGQGVHPDGSRMTAGDRVAAYFLYQSVLSRAAARGPRASALRPDAGPAAKRIFGLP